MDDASGAGRADFISISLHKVDARMQREAAEERIGAIAERRRDAGVAAKPHAQGHERHQRFQALGGRHIARDPRQRSVDAGAPESTSAGI